MVNISSLKGLTSDSCKVENGFLFAAFPGAKADGREFIDMAIEKGASVILAPMGTNVEGAELIEDENPRLKFAHMAAEFYAKQPENIVAVTGTNGKTSVVSFAEQLWAAAGYTASSIGTLKGNLTTPDPVALHEKLAELATNGVGHLALEASSHGLDQYRLDGVKLSAAGFTNLTRDHLDYHGDMAAYLKAKARLFADLLPDSGVAVLNADDEAFPKLKNICDTRNINVISYGYKGDDLTILKLEPKAHGQELELAVFGHEKTILLPLVGEFQAMNVLCALGLVFAKDIENKPLYLEALESLKGVSGRLQYVAGHPQNAAVYVDYAHTPDALEHVLDALRPHTKGQLVCMFGCGGDRDKGKRPQMGKVAHDLADIVIVTDDNPRSEDPAAIRAAVLEGAKGAQEIEGRRAAIQSAINALSDGDVLVIAGKGHETGQIFADRTEDFDDVREAENAILTLKSKGK